MKVLSTDGLTKLIQLIKSSFISVDNTIAADTATLATVATSGSYNDLSDKSQINSVELVGNKTLEELGIQPVGDYASAADVEYLQNRTYTDGLYLANNNVKVLYDGETINTKPVADVALTPLVEDMTSSSYFASWLAENPEGPSVNKNIRIVCRSNPDSSITFAFGGLSNSKNRGRMGFQLYTWTGAIGKVQITWSASTTTQQSVKIDVPGHTSSTTPLLIQADFDAVNKKWALKFTPTEGDYPTTNYEISIPSSCTNFATTSANNTYYGFGGVTSVYYTSAEVVDKLYVPVATVDAAGIVKPDGETITVSEDGTVSATLPTIATSVSASSTNTETVGAKLFYDTCGDIESLINAL